MSEETLCAICEAEPAAGKGEHVWPSWYLKDLDRAGPPEGGWFRNNEPVKNRDGELVRQQTRQRVLLPACATCNTELDRRFEKPAKDPIRRLVSQDWAGAATQHEWQAIGLWFAKVLLLLGSPKARYENPHINKAAMRFGEGTPDLSWLVQNQPAPVGLSLWAFNAKLTKEAPTYRVPVPRVVHRVDGASVQFHFMMRAMEGLCLTLLSHPGWQVEHPLVENGDAWELLHGAPPTGADLSLLPKLSYTTVAWTTFVPTLAEGIVLDPKLPPLRATDQWPVAPEVMDVLANCGF